MVPPESDPTWIAATITAVAALLAAVAKLVQVSVSKKRAELAHGSRVSELHEHVVNNHGDTPLRADLDSKHAAVMKALGAIDVRLTTVDARLDNVEKRAIVNDNRALAAERQRQEHERRIAAIEAAPPQKRKAS